MNAEYIISSVKQTSETLFRDGEIDTVERLSYRIQMLESHIRILHQHIDNARDEIKELQLDLIAKDK